jgi:hypothetical protein
MIMLVTKQLGLLGMVFIALMTTVARAGTLASSTFDTDLDGWTSNTPSQVVWESTGGNPGGFAQFTDATPDTSLIFAPGQFLGNYISQNVTGISFDFNVIAESNVLNVYPYEIDLSGPGGSASWFGATPSATNFPTGWVNVSAAITDTPSAPNGWTVTNGTWQGLLGNVTSLDIPIELVNNDQVQGWVDEEGIDNVVLAASPVSEATSISILVAGFALVFYAQRRQLARFGARC